MIEKLRASVLIGIIALISSVYYMFTGRSVSLTIWLIFIWVLAILSSYLEVKK